MSKVRYGIYLPSGGANARSNPIEKIRLIALAAEDLGFDSVWVGDHTLFPLSIPPKVDGSKLSYNPAEPILEPLSVLAYVAAITRRVRLGTSVLVLPTRSAILTAKAAATIDVLSGGRLILGVAPGWLEREFRLLGVPFERRGALTDEGIDVLKELWTSNAPRFDGAFYKFADCRCEPRPVQKPHPPIWIGGQSPAALRRVVRRGDGWLGQCRSVEEFAARAGQLKSIAQAERRDPAGITISISPRGKAIDQLVDDIPRYEALGAQHLWISDSSYTPRFEDMLAGMERFAARAGLG